MKGIRVSLALNLGMSLLREVSEAQRELRSKCADAGWEINWVAPPHLHLVIRYLGEIGQVLAPPLEDALRPVVEPEPPVPLGVTGFRLVEHEVKGREIVVDVWDSVGGLASLKQKLGEQLEQLGFEPVTEAASNPVSLVVARVGSTVGEVPLEELLRAGKTIDFGLCESRNLALYDVDSVQAKEEFLRLWRIELRGAGVPLDEIQREELLALQEDDSTEEPPSDEGSAEVDTDSAEQNALFEEGAEAEAVDSPAGEAPATEPEALSEETGSLPADEVGEEAE